MARNQANPVMIKELRARFRTPKTVWILACYLIVMGAILFGFIYLGPFQRSYFQPGQNKEMFILLTFIQLGMIGFLAPGLTAGTISGERERQTLNILLTTQLSPFSIIMNKMITSILFIGLIVLSSLPLYSFVFLYGGISPGQLITMFWFFAVNIFLFGSIGIFCSTWFKRTGVSTIVAYGWSFFIAVGTALLTYFVWGLFSKFHWEAHKELVFSILFNLNPGFVLLDILGEKVDASFTELVTPWILYSVIYILLSFLLLTGATYLLNPLHRK
jgi:ABC-2 type transport system permease protein